MNGLIGSLVSISPSKAHDRAVKAQAALSRSFLDRAGGDRDLAERLRSEHYSELGRRSGARRRAKAAARRREVIEWGGVTFPTEDELLRLMEQ